MNERLKKIALIIAVVSTITLSFSACGTKQTETAKISDDDLVKMDYPINSDVELSYWCGAGLGEGKDPQSLPLIQELEKKTGIKVKFIVPSSDGAQRSEQFNLMLASRELPDIIEYSWSGVSGGPSEAIKNEYIVSLNDAFDKYSPNISNYLSENPDIARDMKTDEGQYYVYPFVRGDEYLKVFNGPILRKDWLDELQLEVPTTIDEWYTVLKEFKTKKNAEAPFTILSNFFDTSAFIGAYGVKKGFYVVDGKVKFGQVENGYKEFLTTMNKWFAEGLLDNNFALLDANKLNANMTSGKSGATVYAVGGGIGKWLGLIKEQNPNYELIGAPYPVLNKGDIPKFGGKDKGFNGFGAAIGAACKNIGVAAKLLDYGYSEEGHMLYNFGIESISYNMEDGYPKYAELVTKNPQNLSMREAMVDYMRSYATGPFVQDRRYFEQYAAMPQQKAAVETWMKTDQKNDLPNVSYTSEESKELANVMSDINTYVNEMFMKFIMGAEPMENYEQYLQTIKNMNIDRAVEITQSAYDRYMQRK